ncbi:5-formyltetrahydrofolate cyclo-ligase [Rhodoblastus sp.]|uniref:5-formyltetrahydrofolate cyclo-ligase n=1 Tax=Rhodoblastus sp. TaxID=1962975 RepID=UPI003F94A100
MISRPVTQPLTPALSPQAGRGGVAGKAELRARLRQARSKVSSAEAEEAARAVADRALALTLQKLETPAPVALYAPLPGELDSFPLLAALARIGYLTLLPVAGEKATPLTFRQWRPGAPLVAGRFGLREPSASAPEMRPEILFLPLLGFDAEGARLGFGGGYYDATLDRLRAKGLTAAIGLGFSCQQAEKIPSESHDQKLDFVITEKGLFDFTDPSCVFSSSAT